jgi:hypothetical protein
MDHMEEESGDIGISASVDEEGIEGVPCCFFGRNLEQANKRIITINTIAAIKSNPLLFIFPPYVLVSSKGQAVACPPYCV